MENTESSGRRFSVPAFRLQGPYSGFVPVCRYTGLFCAQSPHTRPHRGNTAGFRSVSYRAPQFFVLYR